MPSSILVAEDQADIRDLIVLNLQQSGYAVEARADGRAALQRQVEQASDLLILDLMMPGLDGLEVCKALRARGSATPILMLTAKSTELDRVLGLELGADDYVAKPFAPRELVARVRALLRRAAPAEAAPDPRSRKLGFAGWVLDTARRDLTSPEGAAVDLSGAEYDLLMAFLEHPQRVLSREQLLEVAKRRVGTDPFDRTVDVQVSRLRRKIEPEADSPSLIKTVRGAGYMLVAEVTRA